SSWENRKDSWLFPGLIDKLFSNGYGSPELAHEALSLLKDRDVQKDNFNSYFLLSIELTRYLHSQKGKAPDGAIATNYLKASIQKWKKSSSADTNLLAFQLLYQMDPTNQGEYLAEIQRCQL